MINIFLKKIKSKKNKIFFVNDDFLIFHKIEIMKMFPTKNKECSILSNIYYFIGEKLFKNCSFLSRLDFGTKGVFLYSFRKKFFLKIKEQTKKNLFSKYYLLICESSCLIKKKKITIFLKKKKNKVFFDKNSSFISRTNINIVDNIFFDKKIYYIIMCKINSGKTHQIRAHMKHVNAKILGDTKYGIKNSIFFENNLHSWFVKFIYKNKFNMFFCMPNKILIKYYRILGFKKKKLLKI